MRNAFIALLVAVVLGASGICVAKIVSDTAVSIKNKGYVSVKGFAKQAIRSDLGIFRTTIIEEDPNLQVCYQNFSQDKIRVDEFLEKFGIRNEWIKFYPASIYEKYKINERGFNTDEFINYKLSQEFRVQSGDVDKISDLSNRISDLLAQNVKMYISSPEYVYTKLDDLKVEMIGRATANAKLRAEKIASEGHFKLGPVASVRVGIFQITPLHSTEVSNYGFNDTTSIDKEVKSVVEIKYFVK